MSPDGSAAITSNGPGQVPVPAVQQFDSGICNMELKNSGKTLKLQENPYFKLPSLSAIDPFLLFILPSFFPSLPDFVIN
jgi:hypothetical protein